MFKKLFFLSVFINLTLLFFLLSKNLLTIDKKTKEEGFSERIFYPNTNIDASLIYNEFDLTDDGYPQFYQKKKGYFKYGFVIDDDNNKVLGKVIELEFTQIDSSKLINFLEKNDAVLISQINYNFDEKQIFCVQNFKNHKIFRCHFRKEADYILEIIYDYPDKSIKNS